MEKHFLFVISRRTCLIKHDFSVQMINPGGGGSGGGNQIWFGRNVLQRF